MVIELHTYNQGSFVPVNLRLGFSIRDLRLFALNLNLMFFFVSPLDVLIGQLSTSFKDKLKIASGNCVYIPIPYAKAGSISWHGFLDLKVACWDDIAIEGQLS